MELLMNFLKAVEDELAKLQWKEYY